jgi:serine/threonine protein kinase
MGGVGTMSLARHVQSGEERAVKMIIAKDGPGATRAQKEIDVFTNLNHPNVARFIGAEVDGNIFYVIMEYYDRGDLNKYLRDQNRAPRDVPANLVLRWFRQLALAIAVSFSHKPFVPLVPCIKHRYADLTVVLSRSTLVWKTQCSTYTPIHMYIHCGGGGRID